MRTRHTLRTWKPKTHSLLSHKSAGAVNVMYVFISLSIHSLCAVSLTACCASQTEIRYGTSCETPRRVYGNVSAEFVVLVWTNLCLIVTRLAYFDKEFAIPELLTTQLTTSSIDTSQGKASRLFKLWHVACYAYACKIRVCLCVLFRICMQIQLLLRNTAKHWLT